MLFFLNRTFSTPSTLCGLHYYYIFVFCWRFRGRNLLSILSIYEKLNRIQYCRWVSLTNQKSWFDEFQLFIYFFSFNAIIWTFFTEDVYLVVQLPLGKANLSEWLIAFRRLQGIFAKAEGVLMCKEKIVSNNLKPSETRREHWKLTTRRTFWFTFPRASLQSWYNCIHLLWLHIRRSK